MVGLMVGPLSLVLGLLSPLGGPQSLLGGPMGGVSDRNKRKNNNSLMLVPKAAAQKDLKSMASLPRTAQTPKPNHIFNSYLPL